MISLLLLHESELKPRMSVINKDIICKDIIRMYLGYTLLPKRLYNSQCFCELQTIALGYVHLSRFPCH